DVQAFHRQELPRLFQLAPQEPGAYQLDCGQEQYGQDGAAGSDPFALPPGRFAFADPDQRTAATGRFRQAIRGPVGLVVSGQKPCTWNRIDELRRKGTITCGDIPVAGCKCRPRSVPGS